MRLYTEHDWSVLIRQDDPAGWHALGGDLASWTPTVERICAKHGLAVEGEVTMRQFTNTLFFTRNLVIKTFAWHEPIWFAREVEALQVLGGVPRANTPRLLGYGASISDEDQDHPYLIMERLPGEPFHEHRGRLSIEEKCALVSQLAERMRAMHELPTAGLEAFQRWPGEWVRHIQARAAQWGVSRSQAAFFSDIMPPYLRAQALAFFAENLGYVTEDFHPCLLNGDLNAWNILIAEQGGTWRVTGLVDFGYAEVGPVEYEWVSLCQNALGGNETLIRAFYTAYGWPMPVPPAMKQRLKLYTLLHRFSPLYWRLPPKDATDGPALEAILDALWPI